MELSINTFELKTKNKKQVAQPKEYLEAYCRT